MKKTLLSSLMAVGLGLAASAQAAVMVEFTPSQATFTGGDSFTVGVSVTGLPAGEIVAGYDLDFLFDDTLLNATGVTFDTLLGDGIDSIQLFDLSTDGLADVFEVSTLSDAELVALQAPGGSVSLFTISFTAEDDGDLTAFQGFRYDAFNDVKCARNQICVPEQTTVPEPHVLGLLGLGLLGLMAARRRAA